MSFQPYPLFKGATTIKSGATDNTGDDTIGKHSGFIVGVPGSAEPAVITVTMLDDSELVIANVQPGAPYIIPHKGVVSVSTGMDEVYSLKG